MYYQFQNERQQCRAIQMFLSLQPTLGEKIFATDQPTQDFWNLVQASKGILSSGETLMVRVALDLWNGEGKVTLEDFFTLPYGARQWLLGLMRAASESPQEMDRWLDAAERTS